MLARLRSTRTPKRAAAVAAAVMLGAVSGTVVMATGAVAQERPVVNPAWGQELPPADAELSRAYQLILESDPKGYAPKAGTNECSNEVHAKYWTYGKDGKVYPTWHPNTDPSGCVFPHEHGDDPRRAGALFEEVGFPEFGYSSEVMQDNMPETSVRHEDHVGHKTLARSPFRIYQGDNGSSFFEPTNLPARTTCNLLVKYHQGLHSPDAFTNNLHEVLYDMSCDDGTEIRLDTMMPIGEPGRFIATDCPGQPGNPNSFTDGTVFEPGPPVPADSPDAPPGTYGRMISDSRCVDAIKRGDVHYEILVGGNVPFSTADLHEFWFSNYEITGPANERFYMGGTLFYALDPARHYNPNNENNIGYNIDICYDVPNIQGDFKCPAALRASQQRLPYDDTRSPFKGGTRDIRLGQVVVQTGSADKTFYTDVFGKRASTTPFEGSIEQRFSGAVQYPLVRGETSGKNWAPEGGTLRAPN